MKRRDAIRIIKKYYSKGGRIRHRIQERFLRESRKQKYKKGFEIRIKIANDAEYQELTQALSICDIKPGRPYAHHMHWVLPIYGKKQVEWFEEEILQIREPG